MRRFAPAHGISPVHLLPIAGDIWLVKYGHIVLGTMKGREGFIRIGPGQLSRPDPPRT